MIGHNLITIINNFFEKNVLLISILLTTLLAFGSLVWSFNNNYITLYGDAASHLNISRRVIDNLTPGLAQLGSSWLPLLHILMLPFIWNNFLWETGLAGGIVSVAAFIGSALLIFKTVESTTSNKLVSFLALLLFILNPNLLYIQTTPMNESLFIFSTLASLYFLVKWIDSNSIGNLIGAAFFGFTAAFNRYEGWVLILGQVIIVALVSLKKNNLNKALGNFLNYTYLAGMAPLFWFIWNWVIFGDPLDFLRNEYSARSQQILLEQGGLLPTAHNLFNSVKYFGWSVIDVFGWPVSILFFISLVYFFCVLVFDKNRKVYLPYLSIIFPAIFLIYTLYAGVTVLHVPQEFPFGMFNVRYSLFITPAIVTIIALFAWRNFIVRLIVLLALVANVVLFVKYPNIITLQDPLEDRKLASGGIGEVKATQYLKDNYHDGLILASATTGNTIMLQSGIPMKKFIHEGTRDYWKNALKNPKSAKWVIMVGRDPLRTRDGVYKNLHNSPVIQREYKKVFEEGNVQIYTLNAINYD